MQIGMLHRKEIDIGLLDYFLTSSRANYVDYSIILFFVGLVVLKQELVVSNGRYTFYQIHFIKHNLSNTFYQIPFIKYCLQSKFFLN